VIIIDKTSPIVKITTTTSFWQWILLRCYVWCVRSISQWRCYYKSLSNCYILRQQETVLLIFVWPIFHVHNMTI